MQVEELFIWKKSKRKTVEFRYSMTITISPLVGSWGGGEGYLTKFNTGRLRPEVQPLTLLYTILAEKVPLSHTYFRNCTSFLSPHNEVNEH